MGILFIIFLTILLVSECYYIIMNGNGYRGILVRLFTIVAAAVIVLTLAFLLIAIIYQSQGLILIAIMMLPIAAIFAMLVNES